MALWIAVKGWQVFFSRWWHSQIVVSCIMFYSAAHLVCPVTNVNQTVSHMFLMFIPIWGNDPNLIQIWGAYFFQMGWNHQLVWMFGAVEGFIPMCSFCKTWWRNVFAAFAQKKNSGKWDSSREKGTTKKKHESSHDTPRKINMEPENDGLEDDLPFPGCILRFHVNLPGCKLVLSRMWMLAFSEFRGWMGRPVFLGPRSLVPSCFHLGMNRSFIPTGEIRRVFPFRAYLKTTM